MEPEEIEVEALPEPGEPDAGVIDPDDRYTEGGEEMGGDD